MIVSVIADPVRLVSQTGRISNQTAGRLEIFINNEWRTVHDTFFVSFFITNVRIACFQLGISGVGGSYSTAGNLG